MGLNLSLNILTSGFLITCVIFFLITGILFWYAYVKIGQILQQGNSKTNDLATLNSALGNLKTAYILAFIASAATLILALLYAGHETVVAPSEYFHLIIYLIAYGLLIISVIYAFLGLNKINTVGVTFKNGADGYIWAGLLMSIFAFIGLTATGSGRLGMNIVRSSTSQRLKNVEEKVNNQLPRLHDTVSTLLPQVHSKVSDIHANTVMSYGMDGINGINDVNGIDSTYDLPQNYGMEQGSLNSVENC